MHLEDLTIVKAAEGLRKKEFSAVELCNAYLEFIEKKDAELHAFLNVNKGNVLDYAKKADSDIAQGTAFAITGIPCAIKDNILVSGIKCTAGSKILENYVAPYDATVVKRLKDAGAVIIGKTNLDEFAMGASTENSAFGSTKNPYDISRVPGGSSGGSAAAVAANMCCFALGSDTGGSVRQPAAFCGVVGLKPTYGSVSRYGLIAFASSLDQVGPIGKTIEDCKIIFDIIAGKDEKDSTSFPRPTVENRFGIKGLRVGMPKEYFKEGLDPGIKAIFDKSVEKMEAAGAKIEEISLPHSEHAIACYYIINPSEASANLARYDGIKYGLSIDNGKNLEDIYLDTREEGFGKEVKRRIMLGTYALSAGYYDAYYLKAQKVRELIKKDFEKAFEKIDVILTPTTPTLPFKLGEKMDDPLAMYLSDVFTSPVNLAGLPAISLPAGNIDGLPVGLQIIGGLFQEEKILSIGAECEKLWI
ncbi:MAG: Glutamyl-tRNA(Gln) amidotransferase subunit A [Parcubacteria group bacterium GW2011_GWC1_38_6]|nr:MAG: Glutamyl-tRNA(Gln) amidotransferase subunit A [Parcubacteria group bacterium GW2011_GWC1_38_6]